MTEQINAFKMAQAQFDSVAQLLNLDHQVAEMLRWPTREYTFQIPVKMDAVSYTHLRAHETS